MWEFILGLLGIVLWLMITGVIMFITLIICAASLFIGAVGGFFIGFIKGIINYFAALREELTFSQD